MFFMKQFNVLAVDDEPDVLAIMKMALRNVTVWGVPINLITAGSKAEAIEILNHYAGIGSVQQQLSVVFLDVVMETDSAGLEVADYIRNTQGNFVTQVYVITGQPGVAPEREVIDRYDISGYLSKSQMDETKLYSMVRSGIREANLVSATMGTIQTAGALYRTLGNRQALRQLDQQIMNMVMAAPDGTPLTPDDVVAVQYVDGQYFAGTVDEETALKLLADIRQLPPQPGLMGSGSYYTDGRRLLIDIPAEGAHLAASTYVYGSLPMTPMLNLMLHHQTHGLGAMAGVSR